MSGALCCVELMEGNRTPSNTALSRVLQKTKDSRPWLRPAAAVSPDRSLQTSDNRCGTQNPLKNRVRVDRRMPMPQVQRKNVLHLAHDCRAISALRTPSLADF
jgi:hypothetical protein